MLQHIYVKRYVMFTRYLIKICTNHISYFGRHSHNIKNILYFSIYMCIRRRRRCDPQTGAVINICVGVVVTIVVVAIVVSIYIAPPCCCFATLCHSVAPSLLIAKSKFLIKSTWQNRHASNDASDDDDGRCAHVRVEVRECRETETEHYVGSSGDG